MQTQPMFKVFVQVQNFDHFDLAKLQTVVFNRFQLQVRQKVFVHFELEQVVIQTNCLPQVFIKLVHLGHQSPLSIQKASYFMHCYYQSLVYYQKVSFERLVSMLVWSQKLKRLKFKVLNRQTLDLWLVCLMLE